MGFMVNTGLKRGVRAWFKPQGYAPIIPLGVAPSYP